MTYQVFLVMSFATEAKCKAPYLYTLRDQRKPASRWLLFTHASHLDGNLISFKVLPYLCSRSGPEILMKTFSGDEPCHHFRETHPGLGPSFLVLRSVSEHSARSLLSSQMSCHFCLHVPRTRKDRC